MKEKIKLCGKKGKIVKRERKKKKKLPLARIPSNCFFARIASATVSKAMMAEPLDRPLRSYYELVVSKEKNSKTKKIGISVQR